MIDEEIEKLKPKGKQIFSEISPYGEEIWEEY